MNPSIQSKEASSPKDLLHLPLKETTLTSASQGIPIRGGVTSSNQKILQQMKSAANVASESTSLPVVTLPPSLQHMFTSPLSLPSLSSSTPDKLQTNGRPPGLALCLSKSNARQLFLCLLQQQQQIQSGVSASLKVNDLLQGHLNIENPSRLVQNQIMTSNASLATFLPAAKLIKSSHEKVVLMPQGAQKSFQRVISVRPVSDNLSQKSSSSSNSSTATSTSLSVIVGANGNKVGVGSRALIRSDPSLEKLRVSSINRTSNTSKTSKHQSLPSTSQAAACNGELLKNFPAKTSGMSTAQTEIYTHNKSATFKKNSLHQKAGIVNQTRVDGLPIKKCSLSKQLHNVKSEPRRGQARPTHDPCRFNRSKVGRSLLSEFRLARIPVDVKEDISSYSVLESSSDEANVLPFHRTFWNLTTAGTIEDEESSGPECFKSTDSHHGLASSRIRQAKYQRLVRREMKRLCSLRKSLRVYETIVKQDEIPSSDLLPVVTDNVGGLSTKTHKDLLGSSNTLRQVFKNLYTSSSRSGTSLSLCLHKDAEDAPCLQPSLPYANHCRRHIMYNVDQQLYTYCTAKCPNNIQCCVSVLNLKPGPPLCHKHLRTETTHSSCADAVGSESFSKKSRKKCRTTNLRKALKKGKRRKTSCEQQTQEPGVGSELLETGKEYASDSDRCEESSEHGPSFSCLSLEQSQSIISSDDLTNSAFEFSSDVPHHGFCKETFDEVLSTDFLGDFDLHIDASTCFMDTPDIQDVFGKLPLEVFDLGSSSLRHF